jgi:hypothetical protein
VRELNPGPDVKKIYVEELRKWQKQWEENAPELKKAQADFETVKNKVDRYEQFKEAIRNKPIGKRIGLKFKTVAKFQRHMLALPFAEKRRIVEAIVSPETGGKCSVGYISPIDFLDEDELKKVPAGKRRKPLGDKSTYVHGNFSIDLSRIESIINGIDRTLLGKEHQNAVSLTDIHGGQGKPSLLNPLDVEMDAIDDEKKDKDQWNHLYQKGILHENFGFRRRREPY